MAERMDRTRLERIVGSPSFVKEMRSTLCTAYERLADRFTPLPPPDDSRRREAARSFVRGAELLDAAWVQLGLGDEGRTFEEVAREAIAENYDVELL